MPRPKLPTAKQRSLVGVRLPVITWQTLDQLAIDQSRPSRNNLIEHIINEYFKANDITPVLKPEPKQPELDDIPQDSEFPIISLNSTSKPSTSTPEPQSSEPPAKKIIVETPFD